MSADINEAIVNIRKLCPYVKNEGQMNNSGGKYSYAKIEDIIHHTRPGMDAEQVTIHPVGFALISDSAIGTRRLVVISVKYKLTHAPSKTFIEVTVPGEGADSADKACNKAMTAALKVAILQSFYIERGNDDPDDVSSEPPAFVPGKGETEEKLVACIKSIDDAKDKPRLDYVVEAAETRAWTQDQYDRICAKANIKLDTFSAF